MDLIHDLLDQEVRDRNGREMGRVDGVVIEVRDGAPPRVACIEIGPAVLAFRIRPIFGRWVGLLEVAFGVAEGRPLRIPFSDLISIGRHVTVDLAIGETSAVTVDRALRSIVSRIPGSS